jgi:hypothetical protein
MAVLAAIAAILGNKYRARHKALGILEKHNVIVTWSDNDSWLNTWASAVLPQELTSHVARIKIRGEPLRGDLLWAVSQLREVQDVTIANTEIGIAECAVVAKSGTVHRVALHEARLQTGAVAALCRSRSLERLHLSFTNTTDNDCKHIAGCTSIRIVGLSGTMVTNDGLRSIARLPQLEHLAISPDYVTPAGIECVIARHPRLVVQCYGPTKFDDTWWSGIEERHPRCKIHR